MQPPVVRQQLQPGLQHRERLRAEGEDIVDRQLGAFRIVAQRVGALARQTGKVSPVEADHRMGRRRLPRLAEREDGRGVIREVHLQVIAGGFEIVLRVVSVDGELLVARAEKHLLHRGQAVERIGAEDLVEHRRCFVGAALVPQHAGQRGFGLQVIRVFVQSAPEQRGGARQLAGGDRPRRLDVGNHVAKRRPAAEQIEVLLNAFGLAKRDPAERPVVARHEVVFIAAERLVGFPGGFRKPAGLVVDRREPAECRREPRVFLQRTAEQFHGLRLVPVFHRVIAGEAEFFGRGRLAAGHLGLKLGRRGLFRLRAVGDDLLAPGVADHQAAGLRIGRGVDLPPPALARPEIGPFVEDFAAGGGDADRRLGKRPGHVERHEQFPLPRGEVHGGVLVGAGEAVHLLDGKPGFLPTLLQVWIEQPTVALGQEAARLQFDILPVGVGEDVFPNQAAAGRSPRPEFFAEALVARGEEHAAAIALVVVGGDEIGRRAGEVVECPERVLVPTEVAAFVDRPGLGIAAASGIGVFRGREADLGVVPGVDGRIGPEVGVVVRERRIRQENAVLEAGAIGKHGDLDGPFHPPHPLERADGAGNAAVVVVQHLVRHRRESVDGVAAGGKVPLDAAGKPGAAESHQPRLDDVIPIDKVEVVVGLVVSSVNAPAEVRQHDHAEIVVFEDDGAVGPIGLVSPDVGLHRVGIDVAVPERWILVFRPDLVGRDFERRLADGRPGGQHRRLNRQSQGEAESNPHHPMTHKVVHRRSSRVAGSRLGVLHWHVSTCPLGGRFSGF